MPFRAARVLLASILMIVVSCLFGAVLSGLAPTGLLWVVAAFLPTGAVTALIGIVLVQPAVCDS